MFYSVKDKLRFKPVAEESRVFESHMFSLLLVFIEISVLEL